MENQDSHGQSQGTKSGFVDRLTTGRGFIILVVVTLLLLILAAASAVFFIRNKTAADALSPPPSLDELAQQYPEISHILQDDKLDSVYKQFMVAFQEGGIDAAYELAQKRGILSPNNEVRMTLELDSEDNQALQDSLKAHGILVTTASGNLIDIAIPVDILEASLAEDPPGAIFMDITGLEQIVRVRLPMQSLEDVGSVETEGVAVIGADAWQAAGITGKGVRIGVLDVGFDKYLDLLGSDLPATVVARSFIHGMEIDQTGNEHGSAVSEIIHDIAPDAELIFADYQTVAEKQAAVDWLLSQDVDIITSSTGAIYGRRDGKGPHALIVDQVYAQGVLWVNSSGNTGYTHYRAVFTDADGNGYHEFAPGDEYMGFSPSGAASVSLNWDDWDQATQDLDLIILDSEGNEIASSRDTQSGPGSDAGEFVYYEFPDEGPYYAAIYSVNTDREVTLDFFLRDGLIEYYSPEYSVNTPGDLESSLTVGAVNWETEQLEDYSSQGPTEDGRIKPDIMAPSGVSSAAYGETWDGTSASCPHVTGAAALLMQAFPDYTASQIRDYLISHSLDMGAGGPDPQTGYGELKLGDPPEISNLPPAAPPAPETPPEPTPITAPVSEATPTLPPTPTPMLEEEPASNSDEGSDPIVALMLFGCVLVPGLLGFGGIGLIAVVITMRRTSSKPVQPDRRDWALPDQPTPLKPQPPPRVPGVDKPPDAVTCWNCGKANQPGTRFCTSCGTNIKPARSLSLRKPNYCVNCGSPLRANSKFCPKCGHPVKPG